MRAAQNQQVPQVQQLVLYTFLLIPKVSPKSEEIRGDCSEKNQKI